MWDATNSASAAAAGRKYEESPFVENYPSREVDLETKRHNLAQAIQREVAAGARVESRTDTDAILVIGKPVNHILHLILTLVTCLAWGVVWIVLVGLAGEKRVGLQVDNYGNVLRQELN